MNTVLIQAGPIRVGEELDADALRSYLAAALDEPIGDLQIRQFPGGFSNLTYLLTNRVSGAETHWVLRRPPFGSQVKSAHDMGREFRVLQALQGIFAPAPRPVHFCDDQGVLNCDFYLMSCVEGTIIRRQHPPRMQLAPERIRQQFFAMFDVLAELHAIDPQQVGLDDFGRPQGYVRRQVEGWSGRYTASLTPDAPDFGSVMQWLHDHMPAENGPGRIIHNDYKLDNVVWSSTDPLRVVGVLDWEMTTVGDPLMDLGCALGYWAESGDPASHRRTCLMPTAVPGAPTRAEIVQRFSDRTGLEVENFDFYSCFGMFRLAVIVQQIYYRYRQGHTRDHRFAAMIHKVNGLHEMCRWVIGRSGL